VITETLLCEKVKGGIAEKLLIPLNYFKNLNYF